MVERSWTVGEEIWEILYEVLRKVTSVTSSSTGHGPGDKKRVYI